MRPPSSLLSFAPEFERITLIRLDLGMTMGDGTNQKLCLSRNNCLSWLIWAALRVKRLTPAGTIKSQKSALTCVQVSLKSSMSNTYPWGKRSAKKSCRSGHDLVGMEIFTISTSNVNCSKFNLDDYGESELTCSEPGKVG